MTCLYSHKGWRLFVAISILPMIIIVEGGTWIVDDEMQRIEASNSRTFSQAYGDDRNKSRVQYDAQGRREPFVPLIQAETNGQAADSSHALSPTQEVKLKVLGIMSGKQGFHAIIQGLEDNRYFVEQGSVLRSEGLQVKLITETHLVLVRSRVDGKLRRSRIPQELVLSFRDEW